MKLDITPYQKGIFLSKILQGPNCWPWIGCRDKDQYGIIRFGGITYKAHRLAYFVEYGMDPGDLFVCHDCDNPPCCRPSHLFLGTNQDNIVDASNKGLLAHKLTDLDVKLLREDYISRKFTQCELAVKYGISKQHTSRLVNNIARKE